MSVNIKRKDKEPTKMEKRDTSIMNFILVALAPLALVLFLGFSWGNSNTINSENLFAEVEKMKKDKKKKEVELDILTNFFSSSVDTLLREFEEKYSSSKKKLRSYDDKEDIEEWADEQSKKIRKIRSKITGKISDYDFQNPKFKIISEMGLDGLVNNYVGVLLEEIKTKSGKEILELGLNLDVDLKEENDDLQEEIDDLKDDLEDLEKDLKRCEKSGDDKQEIIKSDCSRCEDDLKEKEDELEDLEKNIQKKQGGIKDDIDDEVDEIEKLLKDLKATNFSLPKHKTKMERLRNNIERHLTVIKTKTDKLGDF